MYRVSVKRITPPLSLIGDNAFHFWIYPHRPGLFNSHTPVVWHAPDLLVPRLRVPRHPLPRRNASTRTSLDSASKHAASKAQNDKNVTH